MAEESNIKLYEQKTLAVYGFADAEYCTEQVVRDVKKPCEEVLKEWGRCKEVAQNDGEYSIKMCKAVELARGWMLARVYLNSEEEKRSSFQLRQGWIANGALSQDKMLWKHDNIVGSSFGWKKGMSGA